MSPAALRRDLVGNWQQCAGPSIFGAHRGGAVAILANGTWRQLGWTPGGWEPLQGADDAGTWQLLAAPAAATAAGATAAVPTAAAATVIRFVATLPTSSAAAPQTWTARVTMTRAPSERAQFVDGTIVANYRLIVPSATGGSTPTS